MFQTFLKLSIFLLKILCNYYIYIFSGGWNNNPDSQQFRAIYKRMVFKCGVHPGDTGNVQPLDSLDVVLHASSMEDVNPTPFVEDSSRVILDHDYNRWMDANTSMVVDNAIVYIAGWVVKKAVTKLECNTCREVLVTDEVPHYDRAYHLLVLKNRGGLVVPSQGTVAVIKSAEKAIRQLLDINSVTKHCKPAKVEYVVKAELGTSDVFKMENHIIETQHGIDNHQYDLLSLLVHIYFTLRQHHIARMYNLRQQGDSVRHKLTKTILFKGQ